MYSKFSFPKWKSMTNHGLLPVFFSIWVEWFELAILAIVLGGVVIGLVNADEANIMRYFNTDLSMRIFTLAFVIGTAPLLMFFTGPMFRAVSLKYGRKKVMIWSAFASVIASLLLSLGVQFSLWWYFGIYLIFAARAVKGLLTASMPIAMGMLSDQAHKEGKGGILGYHYYQCASFLGVVSGAIVGMLASRWAGLATPFWFVTIAYGVNFIWSLFAGETLPEEKRVKHIEGFLPLKAFHIMKEGFVKSSESIRVVLFGFFIYDVAWSYFVYYMQIYVLQKYSLQDPIFFIGLVWLVGSGIFLASRIFILPTLARLQVGPLKVFVIGAFVSGALLLAASFTDNAQPTFFVLAILAFLGFSLSSSITRVAVLAKCAKQDKVGISMATSWLLILKAGVVASILAAWMQNTTIDLPMIITGSLMLFAGCYFYFKRRHFKDV